MMNNNVIRILLLLLLLLSSIVNINSINMNNIISKVKPFFPILGFYAVMNLPIYGIGIKN